MAVFELVARSQMYIDGQIISKGERLAVNTWTPGVNRYNALTNPNSRREILQQMENRGLRTHGGRHLDSGHWDVKEISGRSYSRTIDMSRISDVPEMQTREIPSNEFRDIQHIEDQCVKHVENFYKEGQDVTFAENGLETRCRLCDNFFENIKKELGIDTRLEFGQMNQPNDMGGYLPDSDVIRLNPSLLENPKCEEMLNTILHESRHAFQEQCVRNPETASVSKETIKEWKDNMKNYIDPEYDFEAYEMQPIEADANDFADRVWIEGTNRLYA